MGASGPSTGGGGGVGPAGIKTDGTYGTKEDAKKASRRNEGRKRLKEIMEQDQNRGGGADADPKPIIVKEDVDETKQETTQEKIVEDETKKSEDKEDKKYDARRTKRRGRRVTILTSPTGTGEGLVLGKPTLLGA